MHTLNRITTVGSFLLGALVASVLTLALAPQPALAQSSTDSEVSQQQKAMHYSLYYENFKNDNFEGARKDLQWILANAPGFPKGDDRNYERAVELYAGLAKQATDDPNKQAAYIDTAMTYLTSAESKMKEQNLDYSEYEWELEKGRFLQQYSRNYVEIGVVNDLFCLFGIGTLKANNNRYIFYFFRNFRILYSLYNSIGNTVAAHNSAKDVN